MSFRTCKDGRRGARLFGSRRGALDEARNRKHRIEVLELKTCCATPEIGRNTQCTSRLATEFGAELWITSSSPCTPLQVKRSNFEENSQRNTDPYLPRMCGSRRWLRRFLTRSKIFPKPAICFSFAPTSILKHPQTRSPAKIAHLLPTSQKPHAITSPSMPNPKRIAAILAASSVVISTAAAARNRCDGEQFTPVTALSALPADIETLLRQPGPLEDRGSPSAVAVMPGPDGSRVRRFGVAAIGGQHAFAAIEAAGGAVRVEVWSFELSAGHWTGQQVASSLRPAASVTDLLHASCTDGG